MGFMKEFTIGDHKDPMSVFRWERVRLELPVTVSYDTILPWVSNRRANGVLADDFFMYMDYMRPLVPSD
jgi:hypothetical protein